MLSGQLDYPLPNQAVGPTEPSAARIARFSLDKQARRPEIIQRLLDTAGVLHPDGSRQVGQVDQSVTSGNGDHDFESKALPEQHPREIPQLVDAGARHAYTVLAMCYAERVTYIP